MDRGRNLAGRKPAKSVKPKGIRPSRRPCAGARRRHVPGPGWPEIAATVARPFFFFFAAAASGEEANSEQIAMSVFKPDRLPWPGGARGRRYYLYHSPEESACPFAMAEAAAKALLEQGADVKRETCGGGHGWHGDGFGSIREGMEWLTKR